MSSSSSIATAELRADAATRTWRWPRYWPLAAVLLLLTIVCDLGPLDQWIAAQFYDAGHGLFPARKAYWAASVLHRGGIWLVALVAALALGVWLLSFRRRRLRAWRGAALYVLVCIAVTTGSVALLKQASPADCPWDVSDYGGTTPYYRVLAMRPPGTPPGHCFPGAHSAGGFSLLALAFIVAARWPRRAWLAIGAVLAIGMVYACTQWARGAHFASHDLFSAWLAWTVASSLARAVCLNGAARA